MPASDPSKTASADARWLGWLLASLLTLPVALGLGRFTWIRWDMYQAERLAVADLARPDPPPAAYGVLGGIRLDQGRLAEALPLLQKASDLEWASRGDSRDTLCLAKAQLQSGHRAAAAAALDRAEVLAGGLAKGRSAQTWFSSCMFRRQLGDKAQALRDLRRAVALQPDDWVDLGAGRRHKTAGLAGYYQKMLAAAQQDP